MKTIIMLMLFPTVALGMSIMTDSEGTWSKHTNNKGVTIRVLKGPSQKVLDNLAIMPKELPKYVVYQINPIVPTVRIASNPVELTALEIADLEENGYIVELLGN